MSNTFEVYLKFLESTYNFIVYQYFIVSLWFQNSDHKDKLVINLLKIYPWVLINPEVKVLV